MTIQERFEEAQAKATTLPQAPDNDILLKLYSLFKQGTVGDATGKKPGMLDFIKKAKFEAWESQKGKSKEQAMEEYVQLVDSLVTKG